MTKWTKLLGSGLLLAGLYQFWCKHGRSLPNLPFNLNIQEIAAFGTNSQRGNFVAVQPWLEAADYASEYRFYAKMNGYFQVAYDQGWFNDKTIVVLPEYIGTWLVAVDEKAALYRAGTLEAAMRLMVLSNLFPFAATLPLAQGPDKVIDALFRMKARPMAAIYHKTFSHLARVYKVTIVAGSIVLPAPYVASGTLVTGDGPLYNVSLIYRPDGRPDPHIVHKVHPITAELPFTAAAAPLHLSVFDTPAGRLAVLICADSWYPDVYDVLRRKSCDLIVVPNNLTPANIWQQPWGGYDPGPMPADASEADIGRLTEGEAWLKYALAGRLASAGATHGLHVYFRGQVWDLGSDGRPIYIHSQTITQAGHVSGASVTNFWL
jgi:predicted amidohydrolase